MEIRFCYRPQDKHFLIGIDSHSCLLYNAKKEDFFDSYIRGIIIDNILYLRIFYPLEDIAYLSLDTINEKSFSLLYDNKNEIISLLKKEGIKIKKIEYNATNDLLIGKLGQYV